MKQPKNCLNCIVFHNCYIIGQLQKIMKKFDAISQIQIIDFNFKCSSFKPFESTIQTKLFEKKFIDKVGTNKPSGNTYLKSLFD